MDKHNQRTVLQYRPAFGGEGGETGQKERSAAAFLTPPAENIVCTQCVKGYNSLGELCPGHKHSHGL